MKEENSNKMTREKYSGIYHFTCDCGGSMAINGEMLQSAIASGKWFRCPNQFYQKCNKSYSAQFFKDNAVFIKAIVPQHL